MNNMKKIPKKLRMLGYDWKVDISKDKTKDNGGTFSWANKLITINDKYGEEEVILLHEIIEAIMVHNLVRYYSNEGNAEYSFHFNHTQFCKIVYDIYIVLKDNKLL